MELDIIRRIRKIDVRYKIAFIATFIMGLLSQGMGLFNKYSFHDDAMNYGVGATYTLGRWMLDILGRLECFIYGDGHYSLPAFNGFLAIFFIALSACILINMLEIKSEFLCAFLACLMVCFPVITSTFGYAFTLHFYMLALLLGLLGAYFICKGSNWYSLLLGIILAGFSVGIYQAYMPVTLTIILFYLIKCALNDDDTLILIKKILSAAISCVLFMAVYLVGNKIYLKIFDAELSDYMGISSMGKNSLSEYIARAIDAYKQFFNPSTEAGYNMYPGRLLFLYKAAILIALIMCVISFVRIFKNKRINAVIFAVLVACIPLSVNFIFVMTNRSEVHSLMVYSQLLPFLFCGWMVEKTSIDKMLVKNTISIITTILAVLTLVLYSRVDNKCYLKAEFAQQEAISYFTTLVTQIKETDGYTDEMQVAFVNGYNITDATLQSGDAGAMSDIGYAAYSADVRGYVNDWNWINFMRQWTGFSPVIADAVPYYENDEVSAMPSYPDKGSIKVIDNVIVVKF